MPQHELSSISCCLVLLREKTQQTDTGNKKYCIFVSTEFAQKRVKPKYEARTFTAYKYNIDSGKQNLTLFPEIFQNFWKIYGCGKLLRSAAGFAPAAHTQTRPDMLTKKERHKGAVLFFECEQEGGPCACTVQHSQRHRINPCAWTFAAVPAGKKVCVRCCLRLPDWYGQPPAALCG